MIEDLGIPTVSIKVPYGICIRENNEKYEEL